MNKTNQPCILVVDDETNILRSIRRTLHKLDVELILAESPEAALKILDTRSIDVVVSDMKMPNINGAELLAQIASKQPLTFRIILSGYADVDSILAAINQGKVHRYLHKPWNNETLLEVIGEGIERTQLRRENARLLALTQTQNRKLQQYNEALEDKVSLRTRQIKTALKNIQQHSQSLEKVLYNLIVSHPNISGAFARQVSKTTFQLATALDMSKQDILVVKLAGLICEIGLIGISSEIIQKPFSELNYEQQKAFMNQVNTAKLILSPLHKLENEINLIATQFEPLSNSPPPPAGARIIAICRDYWRYRLGRIVPKELTAVEARNEMMKYAGVRYDKDYLNAFVELNIHRLEDAESGQVSAAELSPGMILNSDLFNDIHILLLPEGHVFTQSSIAKLRHFERGYAGKLLLDIRPAELEAKENPT